jgi:hypothetical protein
LLNRGLIRALGAALEAAVFAFGIRLGDIGHRLRLYRKKAKTISQQGSGCKEYNEQVLCRLRRFAPLRFGVKLFVLFAA